MLFCNKGLESEYDYGNSVSEDKLSINALAVEINRIQNELEEIYQRATGLDRVINFKNPNQNNEAVKTLYDDLENSFKNRTINDIRSILIRDYDDANSKRYSIAKQLQKLKINKPTEKEQFSDYLQLLYFLYMTTNVVFPSSEVLGRLISLENNFSTQNIPIPGAKEGELLSFIKTNIEDNCNFKNDEEILNLLVNQAIDRFIVSVIHLEECFPVEGSTFSIENYSTILSKSKQSIDTRMSKEDIEDYYNDLFPSQKLLFIIQRYTRRSDANDVLTNLLTFLDPSHINNSLFRIDMEDSDYPLLQEWKNRRIKMDDLDNFLRERELLYFCEQKELTSKQLSKAASEEGQKGMRDFIHSFISYNTAVADSFICTQENDDTQYIYVPFVACIARAYKYISKNKVRIILTLKGQKRNMETSLKGALKTNNGIPQMLPYKIALVLCETVYQQCTHPKYSMYYWFKEIKMETLIYIQKILLHVFEKPNLTYWIKYLKLLADEIDKNRYLMLAGFTESA